MMYRKMEMCLDGTLAMPSSYFEMEDNEMTYVEGGGTVTIYLRSTITASLIKAAIGSGVG